LRTLLIILVLLIAGYYWYGHSSSGPAPNKAPVATDPHYLEVRASNVIGGREIEFALFARALNERDCANGTNAGWASITRSCPTCTAQAPRCSKELPPRYARLFDDVPIPSAYLSGTAGSEHERDIRVVVYGLTDQEGMVICEAMRKELAKNFVGPTHCVNPSRG
jgi:hypothetical protein